MAIRREITVTRKGLSSPIDIVYETNLLPFEFVVVDFEIPSASIAVVYVEDVNSNVRKQVCEIKDNVISFTPEATLFDEGKNTLQLRVTHDEKSLFSFSETVNCAGKIITGDEEEVNAQPTLVEQLLTDVANTNKKVEDALLEVEETKEAFEKKVDESVAQLSNPNLFINGNFQIWSNEENFDVYGASNEEYTTAICDRWYAKHYDLENEFVITKDSNGLLFTSDSTEPCYVYQILDEETFSALQGKILTLSYSYTQDDGESVEISKQIEVVSELNVFTSCTRIELTSGCILHWAKLEVGTVQTPCVPDTKDAIICKLEHESEKQLKIQRNLIVQGNTTGIYSHEDLKHANGLIVLCVAPDAGSYFVCQPMLLPNIAQHFVFDENGEMHTACIQWIKDEGIVKCMNRDDIHIHTISALF